MLNILIVVDMQNGFTRYEQTNKLGRRIVQLTNTNYFDYIIATRFLNHASSQFVRMLKWHRLIESPDIDLIEGLKYDKIIDKHIYTCVTEEFLKLIEEINNHEKPTHIFICGADTDCCVLKTAVDLFEQGIMPLVLTEYCDSNGGPESHQAGLLAMTRLNGQYSLIPGNISSQEQLRTIIEERMF